LVPASHALAHRTDEESRQDPARPSRANPQLFQSQKAILQRRHRGLEQQGQTDNAKSLWIPNFPCYRTGSVSRTGKTTGAKRCPQILLTNQLISPKAQTIAPGSCDRPSRLSVGRIATRRSRK